MIFSDSSFVGSKLNNEIVGKTLRGPKDTKVKLGIKRAETYLTTADYEEKCKFIELKLKNNKRKSR